MAYDDLEPISKIADHVQEPRWSAGSRFWFKKFNAPNKRWASETSAGAEFSACRFLNGFHSYRVIVNSLPSLFIDLNLLPLLLETIWPF